MDRKTLSSTVKMAGNLLVFANSLVACVAALLGGGKRLGARRGIGAREKKGTKNPFRNKEQSCCRHVD